jgi:membrane protease YdiL (CAAX protease family)
MVDREKRMTRPYGWRFIDLAEPGVNTASSYAVAAAIIVLCPLAAAVLLGLAVGVGAAVKHDPPDAIAPLAAVIEQYGPIIIAGAAVLYGTVRIHRRQWRSLVAPDRRIDWRRLAIGLGAELAILAAQLGLIHALVGWKWSYSLAAALPLLAVGWLLVPLQAASEEILFRGYLTQALGRFARSRVAIALLVGLVFGLLHLNAYGPLTVPYFLGVSLIFSLVSLRDNRLELAIGGHAAMNLFAFTAANAMIVEPGLLGAGQAAVPFNWAAIVVLLVNGALFYGLTRLLVRLFCRPVGGT